jgi:hypothetical protein
MRPNLLQTQPAVLVTQKDTDLPAKRIPSLDLVSHSLLDLFLCQSFFNTKCLFDNVNDGAKIDVPALLDKITSEKYRIIAKHINHLAFTLFGLL